MDGRGEESVGSIFPQCHMIHTYSTYMYIQYLCMCTYSTYVCVHTVLMYVYGCAPTYVRMHVIVALRANWCVGVTRAVVIILKPYRTM